MIQLFTTDLISLEEFQEKTAQAKTDIPRLEYKLQTLTKTAPNSTNFEKAMNSVFKNIEKITDIRTLSNAQLKEIIKEIIVDKNGHIDIYLNILQNKAE